MISMINLTDCVLLKYKNIFKNIYKKHKGFNNFYCQL